METIEYKVIAHISTDLPEKFGVPRQSGMAKGLTGRIIFEPDFRNPDALRGLSDFSHLWLIWDFSLAHRDEWSPTVRPPRLGGNKRMGVFATRSPFRPNSIGLSSVEIVGIVPDSIDGPIINVAGVDMIDGTPIIDIKPYIPYTDSHPEANGGFTQSNEFKQLEVKFADDVKHHLPDGKIKALVEILSNDPRPQYQDDPERIYGLSFAGCQVKFFVRENILTVSNITTQS
ncbi:MAG: tRNA (N6-threonylcarbamoyladenosine(37)-N6)-methyltransferase TrmO [Muribaculaceae bacterium]|nr:tRNA (N6-threonylcarbamoyladenosine(37)-N6)-methyltransferase TrmO [Muribaculaceae bacterium]